jgi:hypothetical protein
MVESTLGPNHWHDRMPFFGVETGADSVTIQGNDPSIMAEEIEQAVAGDLDYWAFVAYPPDYGMTHGLDLYLAAGASDLGFALLLQGSWLAYPDDADWADQVERYVGLFGDPRYVRIAGGRPLVFLFDAASMWGTSRFPDSDAAAQAFMDLGTASLAAGAGEPYLVFMGWDPAADASTATSLGFHALSAYAVGGGTSEGAPYESLRAQARATWEAQAATGLGVVPVLGAGWDPRPRIETPIFGEGIYADQYFEMPEPSALGAHVVEGLGWVDAHPDAAPARAVILYAWNEHDEGGWLCPTWTASGPSSSRVEAVAAARIAFTSATSLQNGSFEAPPVDGGWYVVPSAGPPAELAWTSGASAGAYLLADPRAAHFPAAADGDQALLLGSAPWIAQEVTAEVTGMATLRYSLLTGTWPGDPPGTVDVVLSVDGVVVGRALDSTPSKSGIWEEHTLTASVREGEVVAVGFTSTGGQPWLDGVALEVR